MYTFSFCVYVLCYDTYMFILLFEVNSRIGKSVKITTQTIWLVFGNDLSRWVPYKILIIMNN